jgi:hypothetical protein
MSTLYLVVLGASVAANVYLVVLWRAEVADREGWAEAYHRMNDKFNELVVLLKEHGVTVRKRKPEPKYEVEIDREVGQ